MSLSDFLEKLQNKPKPVRLTIMWLGTAVCMIVVFVLWAWSMKSNMSQTEVASQAEEQETESLQELKEEIPSLWQSLKASIGSFFETGTEDNEGESQSQTENDSNGLQDNSSKTPPATLPQ